MSDPAPDAALDLQVALARVDGDQELLREIAILFIEECPRALAEIREAIENQDAAKLERAAHGLKGSVANFGARTAVETAFRLEQMGRTRNLQDSREQLHELEYALTAVCTELAAL